MNNQNIKFNSNLYFVHRFIKIFSNKYDPEFENGTKDNLITTLEASIQIIEEFDIKRAQAERIGNDIL